MQPESTLDLACNSGWYALLAARKGSRVAALDTDETCVNRLFRAASGTGLDLVPAISDLFNPATLPA